MYKPSSNFYSDQDISDLVPEKEKAQPPYLIAMADELISRLVTGRPDLRKLRMFYEGKRSPEAFEHLTKNFGIGNPGRVPFINIIRPRVQYLKGKYLEAGIPHRINSSNSYALGLAEQERLDMFMQKLTAGLTADLTQRVQQAAQGEQPGGPAMLHQDELQKLAEQGDKFQSSLEIASQKIMTEYLTNPELRTVSKMETHLENFLVERETGFDTRPGEPGMLARHNVIPAHELYCDVPRTEQFSEKATVFVRRQLLSPQYVLSQWGGRISPEERRTIAGNHCLGGPWEALPLGAEKYLDLYRGANGEPVAITEQYQNWIRNQDGNNGNLIEVFTVQWIATNEVDLDDPEADIPEVVRELGLTPEQMAAGDTHHQENVAPGTKRKGNVRYKQDLYEVVRLGSNIYPQMGPIINPVRPVDEPWRVRMTFRRYCMDISLVEQAIDSQDKSDVMHYVAENAAATSGTKGSIIPKEDIPVELGNDIFSRVNAMAGLRRLGFGVIAPMQAGGTKGQFSNYQSYDDTLKGDTLTGIRTFIELYEEEISDMTGVNRQMLGSIAERDGKATTEQAITGGTVVTQPIFTLFDILMGDAFTDALNYTRQSFKAAAASGRTMLTLGHVGKETFIVNAESFSLGYFRVYVRDGRKEQQQLKTMVQMVTEFATNNLLPPEEAIEALFADSVTETREHIVNKLREGSAAKMQQLQQQNEELQQQLQKLQQQLDKNGQGEQQNAARELALKEREVATGEREQSTEATQGERELELKAQEVALQRDQAVANASPSSEKVASIK